MGKHITNRGDSDIIRPMSGTIKTRATRPNGIGIYLGLMVLLPLIIALSIVPAHAERKIQGFVKDQTGKPLQGYRVKAVDKDVGSEKDMGEDITDVNGSYKIEYRTGSWDGPHSRHHTHWRPDIVLYVAKPLPGGGWKRVVQSGERTNWKVRNDITQNFTIPPDGECPYPAKFNTTDIWRGCNCAPGMHKRWLDAFKVEARCTGGESEQQQCEIRGGHWVGVPGNDSWGLCADESDLPTLHRQLQREAYYKYMQYIGDGADLEPLPDWIQNRYSKFFKNVDLDEIFFGDSPQLQDVAITDCKKIYFPAKVIESIRTEDPKTTPYFWLLHEIAHSDQCIGLPEPLFLGSKRDKYADMWFANLPRPILISILEDGIPVDDSIHDKMPMEQNADEKAAAVIAATGIGTVNEKACPTGEFSTRDHRGCTCAQGTQKHYSGLFHEKAQCLSIRIIRPNRTP